jgi:hypothetical protein
MEFPMRTISGLFDTRQQAEAAVDALEDAGVANADISILSSRDNEQGDAAEGAGIGAAIGGVGGLLAGIGAFAIPGIGPVVGAGWLATTLMGAVAGGVAGGLIGSMTEAGVDESDAHVYAEGIRRGGTLVTARVADEQVDAAAAILGQSGSIDLSERRAEYETSGWTGFHDLGDPWTEDGPRNEDDPRKVREPETIIPLVPR